MACDRTALLRHADRESMMNLEKGGLDPEERRGADKARRGSRAAFFVQRPAICVGAGRTSPDCHHQVLVPVKVQARCVACIAKVRINVIREPDWPCSLGPE
jgi:hypothetical protein